jgi:purine-nucleoside phosphorylase
LLKVTEIAKELNSRDMKGFILALQGPTFETLAEYKMAKFCVGWCGMSLPFRGCQAVGHMNLETLVWHPH